MKKILFLDSISWNYYPDTPFFEPLGGTQSCVCYLSSILTSKFSVYLMNRCKEKKKVKNIQSIPMRGSHISKADIEEINPDVIITINTLEILGEVYNMLGGKEKHKNRKYMCWFQHDINQPASKHFATFPWEKVDKIIFITKWQQEEFVRTFRIPRERAIVMKNAVAPGFYNLSSKFDVHNPEWSMLQQKKPVLAYTSTPFRGLDRLLDIFPKIREIYPEVELHVYSSMKLYNIQEEEDAYKQLYETCRNMDGVKYIGPLDQNELASQLREVLILAYPNTFRETFCISVAEAMSVGCIVITSNYGSLPEVTGGFAPLVNINMPRQQYIKVFQDEIINALRLYYQKNEQLDQLLKRQIIFARNEYSWTERKDHELFSTINI